MKKGTVHTTNYFNSFIETAPDSMTSSGEIPPFNPEKPTIAALQFEWIKNHPYQYTSDEILFMIYAQRKGLSKETLKEAKQDFFSKGQACLRTSPLAKRYGWGIHFDQEGKVAIYGCETESYEQFSKDPSIHHLKAMKQSR